MLSLRRGQATRWDCPLGPGQWLIWQWKYTTHSVWYFYLNSYLILLRTLQDREYYVYFSIKINKCQENLSNVTEWVSRSPRIFTHISLTALCLVHFPMMTHLFCTKEVFVLICGLTHLVGHIFDFIVFLHQKALSSCKPILLLFFMALLIDHT